MKLGIDIGSTTVKIVLLDEEEHIVFKKYVRHMSDVFGKLTEIIDELFLCFGNISIYITITGSGGMALSKFLDVHFEQEVVACSRAVEKIIPETDVAIELGGEDAKITFYGSTVEQRMNGTCAGGTGAFIDQMAVLLNTDAQGLNYSAQNHKMIYPIAARCGVFAKTDIQPLINEGANIDDLAASIFQAVVNQTISGLACGRAIKGKIAFLGGPLHFLTELRSRFIETLQIKDEDIVVPENPHYFVAIGAAMISSKYKKINLEDIKNKLEDRDPSLFCESKHIEPLFHNKLEYHQFKERHEKNKINRKDIRYAKGEVYLGIDAGSTTTKAVLMDRDKNLLYSFYESNQGKPLEATVKMLKELYRLLPESAYIANAVVTGYGESLLRNAFNIDLGEIETMAHYKAAESFLKDVDFILDIGGQDMKCMKIRDGAIYNIMLNEACSSGCGSFIETYAKSVNLTVENFAQKAIFAENPVDLGTRCTVFMNSKVKQSQKEGATIGDISAGLSYSVIKNALYKVIKLRNTEEAGERIVVQGGTFYNEAVLRAMEKVLGKEVVRPDIAGMMGAYGAAIVAKENHLDGTKSSIVKLEEIDLFTVETTSKRCKLCENRCLMTVNTFNNGKSFITGNRCEKGVGKSVSENQLPNLYQYKYERVFNYKPLDRNYAKRGTIGIPRVLNMYENYPFWFTFFTALGFSVMLSNKTSKTIYEQGMETISSDTICYPAKLVHGHIKNLVNKGVKRIFYPSINFEIKEDKHAQNHYNCPVVATYPEVIANNMDEIFKDNNVIFMNPFLPYDDDKALVRELTRHFKELDISKFEILKAVKKAREEDKRFKDDVRKQGAAAIRYARKEHKKIIVLAGRPYHIDPEINHGIDKIITSFDMVVVTEDSISNNVDVRESLRVLDQWSYHSRLYKAAKVVRENDDMEMIQLNSFGCGIDAITSDQVDEILKKAGKMYTVLKIDEGSNLGAAKIRIRSLKAAVEERNKHQQNQYIVKIADDKNIKRKFTKDMKNKYTLLIPQMSPVHFQFIETVMKSEGYHVVVLPSVDTKAIEEGLRYINNDACYPSIVTLGQIISEIKSGKYDLDKLAVFMSQTGGGCRASNYIALLRKALKDMNLEKIPVVSFNLNGIEKNSGFTITPKMIQKFIMAMVYGDVLMKVINGTKPYEKNRGDVEKLHKKWQRKINENLIKTNRKEFIKNIDDIVTDFENIDVINEKKPKVGVVGEILVKYHPTANNQVVDAIEKEGGEAVVLDLLDFFLYGMYSKQFNAEYLAGKKSTMILNKLALDYVEWYRKPVQERLKKSKYMAHCHIREIATKASSMISLGNQCGEGWLLTGEMLELIDRDVLNIVCLQPFGCLPNHITGKGMLKSLRKYNEKANIVSIDYDPGASNVNQLNRIKLMMATAYKNIETIDNSKKKISIDKVDRKIKHLV